jgi:hypothetical protein
MPIEDRYSGRITRGKVLTLDDVHRTGRYATHLSGDGHLYEHDQGAFWRTHLAGENLRRLPVVDLGHLPMGPWYHLPECRCEVCGPE